jgi:hypothetical protein
LSFLAVTIFHREPQVLFALPLPLILTLGLGMYVMLELGVRIGKNHLRSGRGKILDTLGVIDGPIFALFGLLIAFTFSSALSRFDERRKLIVEEANDIGTAYLRLDLLPEESQEPLRNLFRSYIDSRIRTYELIPDMQAALAEYDRTQSLQAEIWSQATQSVMKSPTTLSGMQLLPALNSMIDITNTRTAVLQFHPPVVIYGMLLVMALVSAVLVGYQMAAFEKRSWLHIVLFIISITLTCYVILDIEYPRMGLIRVDAVDSVLRDVREGMRPNK